MTLSRLPTQHVVAGIALRLGGVLCISILMGLVKLAGARGAPLFEIILFRNLFGFVPLVIYIWRTDGMVAFSTANPTGHILRSLVGVAAMVSSFAAVQYLPLTSATSLQFTSPLFATALAALLLRDKIASHLWGAVGVGFLGMLIMVRPDPGQMQIVGTALGLLGALGGAGVSIAIRQMPAERGSTIVFYLTVASALLGAVGSLFHWVTPDLTTLALLALAGLVGGVGQILLTEAVRVAPIGVLGPFDYTQLVWAAIFGFLVWNEVPHVATVVGAAVVAASGLYILHRELRLSRAAPPAPGRTPP